MKKEESLPQFTSTARRLSDEDNDREDLCPVQTTHTVQSQRQNTVNSLQDEEAKRRNMGEKRFLNKYDLKEKYRKEEILLFIYFLAEYKIIRSISLSCSCQ